MSENVGIKVQNDDLFWVNLEKKKKIPKYEDLVRGSAARDFNDEYLNLLDAIKASCENLDQIDEGMSVSGQILEISKKDIIIDIGYKDNVYVDNKAADQKLVENLKVGQFIDVLITRICDNPYFIRGSISELIKAKVSTKLENYFNENKPLKAYVKECIPAGYMLDIEIDLVNIEAFMPNTLADVNKLWDQSILHKKTVNVMLETLQQERGVYVVSRKKYLKSLIAERVDELKKNVVYTGHVTGTTPFGVFIQFNECLTGMIHKANINEEYRDKITEIKPGTLIDFYVRDIITKGNSKKIILTQILRESLWDDIKVGMVLSGKVFSVKPFGALVELDPETNGLIQTVYLQKNNRALEKGEVVEVRVISVNRDDRKIYLTFADDSSVKLKKSDIDKLKEKFNN